MLYLSQHQGLVITLIILWTLPWKGVALWRAGRENSKIWFVLLLLINTLGLLDILYIFVFSRNPHTKLQLK